MKVKRRCNTCKWGVWTEDNKKCLPCMAFSNWEPKPPKKELRG